MEPISITSEPTNPGSPDLVSITPQGVGTLPDEVIQKRAWQTNISWGTSPGNPGIEAIRSSISAGNENLVRNQYAAEVDNTMSEERLKMLQQYAADKMNSGLPVNQEELQLVALMANQELKIDPAIIFEKQFSEWYVGQLPTMFGEGKNKVFEDVFKINAETSHEEMDVATNVMLRNQYLTTQIENLKGLSKTDDETDIGFGFKRQAFNDLKEFIPGYTLYQSYGAVPDAPTTSLLPGKNRREQIQYLYTLPFKDFKEQFDRAVASFNPREAVQFAQDVRSYGVKDEYLRTAFGLADVADITSIAATPIMLWKEGLFQSVRATMNPSARVEQILSQSGAVDTAAFIDSSRRMREAFIKADTFELSNQLQVTLPSLFNTENIFRGAEGLYRERADRLTTTLMHNAESFFKALGLGHPERWTDEALAVGLQESEAKFRQQYFHLNDSIINVDKIHDQATNTWNTIIQLGHPDASLFKSQQEALWAAEYSYKLLDDSYKVRQYGNRFIIEMLQPVDETTDAFRDALIKTKNIRQPNLADAFIGFIRSPEDTMSALSRDNRHIVTHAPQEFFNVMREIAGQFRAIPRAERNNLGRFLTRNRDEVNLDGTRGVFYANSGDFEQAWQKMFKSLPSEQTTGAYYAYVQMNDMDYIMRNFGLYRDKSRLGIQQATVSISHVGADGKHVPYKVDFEAKLLDGKPDFSREAGIVLVNDDGTARFLTSNELKGDAAIKEMIDQKMKDGGYRFVQVANPLGKPFKDQGFGNEIINFVFTKDYQTSPLTWNQLPYKPGGHVEYKHGWFVKQPNIRTGRDGRLIYEGDTSIFNFATQAEAKKYAASMDTARILLGEKKLTELSEYLSKNLPYDVESFRALFEPVKAPDGTVLKTALLNIDNPIRPTKTSRRVLDDNRDLRPDRIEDATTSPYNLTNDIDKRFAGERDATTLPTVKEGKGTENDPLFRLAQSDLIDPYNTMARAMGDILRSRFMNDYKTFAVESWVQKYWPLLSVSKETARRNPFFHFHDFQPDLKHPSKDLVAAAIDERKKVLDFIGRTTPTGDAVNYALGKVADSIYNVAGQKWSGLATDWLPTIQDPAKYFRAAAFHLTLGLFNPVQLFVQGQTMAHVMAVAGPRIATPAFGTGGIMWRAALSNNMDVIKQAAEMSHKLSKVGMGLTREQFMESYEHMVKTGIRHVEGENAWRDDFLDPQLWQNGVQNFLDKGVMFFRGGERLVRMSAWNAAYLEWKTANPSKTITNQVRNEILTRADTLWVNMTRASSASWQQGLLSIPTQFFGYQIRLMEQFMGQRLTPMERVRAFATYSALYGVPTAMGAATAYPWYEDIRTHALNNNIKMGPIDDALHNGIISMLATLATNREWNVPQRWGPGGLTGLRELFNKDKSWVDIALGAPGSILGGAIENMDPFWKVARGVWSKDAIAFSDLTLDDLAEAGRSVSTLNNAAKLYFAFTAGKYISKRGLPQTDMNKFEGILSAVTGLTPREMSDAGLMTQSLKGTKDSQKHYEMQAIANFRNALDALSENDQTKANAYFRRAKMYVELGDFRPEQRSNIFRSAMKDGYQDRADRIPREFYEKGPWSQRQQRMEGWLERDRKTKERRGTTQ